MTKASREKSKFRRTSKWKNFRKYMKNKYKVDYLTGFPLRKGWQLHHLDMGESTYSVLDESRFLCLNRMSHSMVHDLFRYYRKDSSIIEKLNKVMELMKTFN